MNTTPKRALPSQLGRRLGRRVVSVVACGSLAVLAVGCNKARANQGSEAPSVNASPQRDPDPYGSFQQDPAAAQQRALAGGQPQGQAYADPNAVPPPTAAYADAPADFEGVTIANQSNAQPTDDNPYLVGYQTLSNGQQVQVVTYVHTYADPIESYPRVWWSGQWYYNVNGNMVWWSPYYGGWCYYWGPPAPLVWAWNWYYPWVAYSWGWGFYGYGWYWGGGGYWGWHAYGRQPNWYQPARPAKPGRPIDAGGPAPRGDAGSLQQPGRASGESARAPDRAPPGRAPQPTPTDASKASNLAQGDGAPGRAPAPGVQARGNPERGQLAQPGTQPPRAPAGNAGQRLEPPATQGISQAQATPARAPSQQPPARANGQNVSRVPPAWGSNPSRARPNGSQTIGWVVPGSPSASGQPARAPSGSASVPNPPSPPRANGTNTYRSPSSAPARAPSNAPSQAATYSSTPNRSQPARQPSARPNRAQPSYAPTPSPSRTYSSSPNRAPSRGSYSSPSRSYSPPSRSYSPPSRSSGPSRSYAPSRAPSRAPTRSAPSPRAPSRAGPR